MKINLIENGKAITRDMTPEEEAEYIKDIEHTAEPTAAQKISEYKRYLADTDYIVIKIAEALSVNDTSTVSILRTEYATELAKRERARILINSIEKTQSI